MDKQIVISFKTILFAFLLGVALYVVYRLGNVLGLFAVALMLVLAMESFVKKLMQQTVMNKKISRNVAVITAYSLLVIIMALIMTVWLPPFLGESQKLIKNLPKMFRSIQFSEDFKINFSDIVPQASAFSGSLLNAILSLFSNITTLFTIFVMSLYMSLDWINLKKRFVSLFPNKVDDLVTEMIAEMEISIGYWIKGEAILMLVVGFTSFLGLLLLNVDYPLSLGLISGFLEVVPMIGPIISAIIASVVALADTPMKALGVVVLFTAIQQLENNFLVPKVMQKVSGFSPLLILFALLAGGEFFGVIGAILAVPVTMMIGIIVKNSVKFMR